MKAISWITAGVGIGLAAYIVLNEPGPQYATENDDIEDAAGRIAPPAPNNDYLGPEKVSAASLKKALGKSL